MRTPTIGIDTDPKPRATDTLDIPDDWEEVEMQEIVEDENFDDDLKIEPFEDLDEKRAYVDEPLAQEYTTDLDWVYDTWAESDRQFDTSQLPGREGGHIEMEPLEPPDMPNTEAYLENVATEGPRLPFNDLQQIREELQLDRSWGGEFPEEINIAAEIGEDIGFFNRMAPLAELIPPVIGCAVWAGGLVYGWIARANAVEHARQNVRNALYNTWHQEKVWVFVLLKDDPVQKFKYWKAKVTDVSITHKGKNIYIQGWKVTIYINNSKSYQAFITDGTNIMKQSWGTPKRSRKYKYQFDAETLKGILRHNWDQFDNDLGRIMPAKYKVGEWVEKDNGEKASIKRLEVSRPHRRHEYFLSDGTGPWADSDLKRTSMPEDFDSAKYMATHDEILPTFTQQAWTIVFLRESDILTLKNKTFSSHTLQEKLEWY